MLVYASYHVLQVIVGIVLGVLGGLLFCIISVASTIVTVILIVFIAVKGLNNKATKMCLLNFIFMFLFSYEAQT